LPHFYNLSLIFVIVFVVSGLLFPQITHAGWLDDALNVADLLLTPFGWIATLILQLASLLAYLSGVMLNFVVQYSVVDMKANLAHIGAVDLAWGTMRDLANMCFIFILLYAAIKTIVGQGDDTRKLIVSVIGIAVLINFSLFLTKLVIDASNVLAVTFYDAIAPGALSSDISRGIASSLMEPLKITSLWDIKGLGLAGRTLIIIGVMGTVVNLIAAFVFFAVAIMFVIRFVVLVLVMILSPLAFLGYTLPEVKSQVTNKWWDALIGQAFFAPIYFVMTWIVIVVSRGLLTGQGGTLATAFVGTIGPNGEVLPPTATSIGILVNFIIVIVLLIASLIIAKDWANKAPGGVSKLTSWAMGAAGGATMGMAGRFGRNTIGRAGQALGDSDKLKAAVVRGGAGGIAARLALATGRKTGGASFDVRGMGALGALDAGKAQKGGFAKYREEKAKDEAKFAASLAPSAKAIAKNPTLKGNEDEINKGVEKIDKEKQKIIGGVKNSEILKQAEIREKSAHDTVSRLESEAESAEGGVKGDKIKQLEIAKTKLEEIKREAGAARAAIREETEKISTEFDERKEALRQTGVKPIADTRKNKFADVTEKSVWNKIRGYNYDASAQIRKGKKSAKDLIEEALRETGEKKEEPKTEKEEGGEEKKET